MGSIRRGFQGAGGGGSVTFASTEQAQAGTAANVAMSPLGVSLKLRHDLGEERITGMRRFTGNLQSITVGHFGFASANAPFVQTIYLRAHTAAEHAKIISEITPGAVIILTQSETINTLSRIAVAAQVPVQGSDVPIIVCNAVYHASRGTFSNDVDCNLDIIGSIKSGTLKSFDSKQTHGGTNFSLGSSWLNVPHSNVATAPASDYTMELFMSSAAGGINTSLNMVSAWVADTTDTKKCDARVRWSTDNGTTWNNESTLSNLLHHSLRQATSSDGGANLPIAAAYQIRPNTTGKVLVNWQIRTGGNSGTFNNGAFWRPDFQFAQAVEI